MKSIMGLLHPTAGTFASMGKEIAGRPPFEMRAGGSGMSPKTVGSFKSLTVHENLLMGIKKSAASSPPGIPGP